MRQALVAGKFYKFLGILVLGFGYLPTMYSPLQSLKKNETIVCNNTNSISLEELLNRTNGLLSFIDEGSTVDVAETDKSATLNDPDDELLCADILSLHQDELLASTKTEISDIISKTIQGKSISIAKNCIKTIHSGKFAGCRLARGIINSNFYIEAMRLGIPANVVNSMVKNLSSKINFRRTLKSGNTFEVVFNNKKMLYCHFEAGKNNKIKASIYGIEEAGKMTYCFEDGTKVIQPSTKTFGKPLAGSMKISSPYGMRVHPIKGIRCYHSGVDLSARYGAPVYAISDGVVMRASRYAGYGNCVEISHASGYKSLYGHLSRYAVRCGTRVKKGQVIGYIGSTGMSTGPHLHLELARYNRVMNPFSVKMLPNETGKIKDLNKLQNYKKQIKSIVSK